MSIRFATLQDIPALVSLGQCVHALNRFRTTADDGQRMTQALQPAFAFCLSASIECWSGHYFSGHRSHKNSSTLRTHPLAWSTKTPIKADEKRCSTAEKSSGRHRLHSKRCVTLSSIFKSKSKSLSRPINTCASSYRNESELKLQGASA